MHQARDLAAAVLDRLDLDEDSKVSFVYGAYSIHYITRPRNVPSSAPEGLTYIVVVRRATANSSNTSSAAAEAPVPAGTAADGRRVPFLFLMDLESIFRSKYLGRCVGSTVDEVLLGPDTPQGLPELAKDVRELLARAERGDNDVAGLARQEIEDVRTVMIENVERVLERGERINLLVSKTDRMNSRAVEFRKVSTRVRHSMWFANVKFKLLLALAGAIIVYLAMGFLCGLPGLDRCF